MAAIQVDLAAAQTMDPNRVTDQEGRWYLRRLDDSEDWQYHVALLSERAPEGTKWSDLKPGRVEIMCDNEDGIELDPVLLAAFCAWPPPSDGGPA